MTADFVISQDTTVAEVKAYLSKGGDVKARIRNPRWYESSSGQYLAMNILAVIIFVVVWIISWLFGMGSIMTGLITGPIFFAVSELVPKRYLLGYDKPNATARATIFCMLIVRSPLWFKITWLALLCVSIVGPALYHALQHRNLGEDNSLLHLAVFFSCSRDVIKVLLDAGADVNARNSDLNTPLHFAIADLDTVHMLLASGAECDAENHKQRRPLDLVKKPGVAKALLDAGATGNAKWQPVHEMGSYRNNISLKIDIARALRAGHSLCFLSHHKGDAAATAVFLHGVICSRFKLKSDQVFLDSNALEDLRNIISLVKTTKVLVVLQTKHVLTRPFCLAEMKTAIAHQIPIIAVNVEGQGYDYEDAKAFLASKSFKEALEERNPGAWISLEEQGMNVDEIGQSLNAVIPNIISKPFNPSASERVRASQIDDIMQAISDKL